jgi:hypothetical protein
MKHQFAVYARYPEAPVKYAYQETNVTARNFRQAANQALKEFHEREGIKRKQLKSVTLTIVRATSEATHEPS